MTIEEAIAQLNTFKISAKSELGENALDLAIKALEKEPCEDTISRQAAIDYVDDVPYIKEHPIIGLLWKAWLEQLPSAQPEQRWIPCSERLPEVGEKMLCQCQANIYEVLEMTVHGWYHDNEHCYMLGFVIAWMPLPKPYKAESEG